MHNSKGSKDKVKLTNRDEIKKMVSEMDEKTELLFLEEIISKRIKILNQGKRK